MMKSKSIVGYDTDAIIRKLLPSHTHQANLIVPVPGPAVGVRRGVADPAKSVGGPISAVSDGEALFKDQLLPICAGQVPGGADAILRKLLPIRTPQASLIAPVPADAVGVGWRGADSAYSMRVPVCTVGDGEAKSKHSLPSIRADLGPGGAGALADQQNQPIIAGPAGAVGVELLAALDLLKFHNPAGGRLQEQEKSQAGQEGQVHFLATHCMIGLN